MLPNNEANSSSRDAVLTTHRDWSSKPITVYLVILLTVFLLDLVETWVSPALFPFLSDVPQLYHDPFLTTLFVAPVLWILLIRPLQRAAKEESALNEAVKAQVVDAIVTIDIAGRIIAFNPAAEKIFGYVPEEITDRNAADLFCDAALAAANLEKIAAPSEHGSHLIHEVVCHKKNGKPLNLEISVSRLLVDGRPQFLLLMRDMTLRNKLEREAREMQAKLIQANKMTALGLMVSGVAHEINNPNNYIFTNAQLLERSCGDIIKVLREYQKENGDFSVGGIPYSEMENHFPEIISGVIDGSQRINSIINDLKTFARQSSGTDFELVDINHAVKAALSIVRSQVSRYTYNFYTEFADNLPKVKGNSQQVGQVVINLIMNACQALPDETASIGLETSYDRCTEEVVIAVADEGGGISEELAGRVMEPFFSTKASTGGTGLGLSISETIVKNHSGRLLFHSSAGTGTYFEVRFPMIKQSLLEAQ